MELHEHGRQLLTQLSPPLRSAFLLRDLNGLTTHEAAVILGVSDGTLTARLTRARAQIHELVRPSLDAKIHFSADGYSFVSCDY
jgi:RNA polymerase sigma-70 factor, ECF subfamily